MNDQDINSTNEAHIPGKCKCELCIRSPQILGSLTGWLLNTEIETVEKDNEKNIPFCPKCNLKINPSTRGSLTQWIFKYELCKCENKPEYDTPEPSTEAAPYPYSGKINLDDYEEIEVSSEFPKERFMPIKKVASGATGTIYQAIDKILNKIVAIKTINIVSNDQFILFQNEAKAISSLNHPNIVKVFDFSASESGSPYMVMEYIEGKTLREIIKSHSLSESDTIDLFIQISDALEQAHSKGILHRDLKPDNIIITSPDSSVSAKVVDFGLAKISKDSLFETGTKNKLLVGTPAYMSPDSVLGGTVDHRSDIYSLGAVLFECISGKPAFEADTPMQIMSMKCRNEAPSLIDILEPDAVSNRLAMLVSKALAISADDRFQSMEDLKQSLKDIRDAEKEESQNNSSPLEESAENVAAQSSNKGLALTIACSIISLLLFVYLASFFLENQKTKSTPARVSQRPNYYDNFHFEQVGNFHTYVYKTFVIYIPDNLTKPNKAEIKELAELEKIDGVAVEKISISEEDINALKNKNLKVLSMKYCQISDAALNAMGDLDTLVELNMANTSLRNKPTDFLPKLKNLKLLCLSSTKIAANDLSKLKNLPLETLLLSNNDLEGRDLDRIASIQSLQLISLGQNNLSERDLTKFRFLKNLKVIKAPGCRGITQNAPSRLKHYLPGVKIYIDSPERIKEGFDNLPGLF